MRSFGRGSKREPQNLPNVKKALTCARSICRVACQQATIHWPSSSSPRAPRIGLSRPRAPEARKGNGEETAEEERRGICHAADDWDGRDGSAVRTPLPCLPALIARVSNHSTPEAWYGTSGGADDGCFWLDLTIRQSGTGSRCTTDCSPSDNDMITTHGTHVGTTSRGKEERHSE